VTSCPSGKYVAKTFSPSTRSARVRSGRSGHSVDDRAGAIGFDLRVGVAPRQRVRLQRFPKRHRGHFGIRPIVEQGIDGVIRRALFAAPEPAIREQRE
jgi:hypothetical protein